MDYYQQYDMSFAISITNSNLIFKQGSPQGFEIVKTSQLEKTYSSRFQFNEHTREVQQLKQEETPTRDWIYIHNLAEELYRLYTSVSLDKLNLYNCKQFLAIVRYFQVWLNLLCKDRKVRMERIFFVFVMPNEWMIASDITDSDGKFSTIVDLVMLPLLREIGFDLTEDYRHKVCFVSALEDGLSYLQLASQNKQLSFIQNEGRCLKYDYHSEEDGLKLETTYFQLKEDYNLRLLNEKLYIPKIISICSGPFIRIDYDQVEHRLSQWAYTAIVGNRNSKRVDSKTMDRIVREIVGSLSDGKLSGTIEDNRYRQRYFSKDQLDYMISESFYRDFKEVLRQSLVKQLQTAIGFIKDQHDNIPFNKKSIIFDKRKEESYFKDDLDTVFSRIVNDDIHEFYKTMDKSTWCIFPFLLVASPSNAHFINYHGNGALLMVVRKAMVSNMRLPPLIVTENKLRNGLGLPMYHSNNQMKSNHDLPQFIVYLDIWKDVTGALCEGVDRNGFIIEQFNIDTQNLDQWFSSKGFDISLFRACLVENQMNFKKSKKHRHKLSSMLRRVNRHIFNERLVDRSSAMLYIRSLFTTYIKHLIGFISHKLTSRNIQYNKVRYAVSLECTVMKKLQIKSRLEVLKILEESGAFGSKMVNAIDQDEKLVWDMYHRRILEKPCYYVQAHMSDDSIHFKLNQVVDVSGSNGGTPLHSILFIKDKTVDIKNTYRQVTELLWSHVHSLDNEEKKSFFYARNELFTSGLDDFEKFDEELTYFIKEQKFYKIDAQNQTDLPNVEHDIAITASYGFSITMCQLLNIAIVPVVRQLASVTLSCIVDEEIFGRYEIAHLFLTGSFLKTSSYNEIHHYAIEKEMNNELKRLIREKTYRTKYELLFKTFTHDPLSKICSMTTEHKSFCFDLFSKGELRTVASASYIFSNLYKDLTLVSNNESKHDKGRVIIARGTELLEERIHVTGIEFFSWPTFCKYSEPCTLQDFANKEQFPEIGTSILNHPGHSITGGFNVTPDLNTVHVQVLNHLSCIKITFESYDGIRDEAIHSFVFGERQTLKYF